jgi:hypothetical protein
VRYTHHRHRAAVEHLKLRSEIDILLHSEIDLIIKSLSFLLQHRLTGSLYSSRVYMPSLVVLRAIMKEE